MSGKPSKDIAFVGVADGPPKFVPAFGCDVGTFTVKAGGKHPALNVHVPVRFRGPYRATDLANYDPDKEYRTDNYGFALCLAKTKADDDCSRKAVNRTLRCVIHGGRLHPLDLLVKPTGEPETEATLSRYQQFLAKQITVDDLDDEELMSFGFRDEKGKIFKPKNVPREMVSAFTRAIFDRSLDSLKSNALMAANTISAIMIDDSIDANIRLKAAESILDRTLGKAPLLVTLNANSPWETVFEGITAATREQSRLARLAEPLDAEVVPDDAEALGNPADIPAIGPFANKPHQL